uniref:Uncharacterized protein n=1 Tax=Strigamia maritima TaxID=126957 RepID=T1JE12_STRMM
MDDNWSERHLHGKSSWVLLPLCVRMDTVDNEEGTPVNGHAQFRLAFVMKRPLCLSILIRRLKGGTTMGFHERRGTTIRLLQRVAQIAKKHADGSCFVAPPGDIPMSFLNF